MATPKFRVGKPLFRNLKPSFCCCAPPTPCGMFGIYCIAFPRDLEEGNNVAAYVEIVGDGNGVVSPYNPRSPFASDGTLHHEFVGPDDARTSEITATMVPGPLTVRFWGNNILGHGYTIILILDAPRPVCINGVTYGEEDETTFNGVFDDPSEGDASSDPGGVATTLTITCGECP